VFVVAIAMVAGCARSGAETPALITIQRTPWTCHGVSGHRVDTAHYAIHTTIEDQQVVETLARVLEGAYEQFSRAAPAVDRTGRPMLCYVFATRTQWARHTQNMTGGDASVYLRILRGGYTVNDVFVSYDIGAVAMYSVAAHEAFHQYAARHMDARLPPFLEEGLACTFESITFNDGAPRWDLDTNLSRGRNLSNAIELGHTWPLDELIKTHAGNVVGLRPARIEAFYAQCWAFARFLQEGNDGRYRQGLRRLLADAAAGTLTTGNGPIRQPADGAWDPQTARPLLEHYLGADLEQIDQGFQWYMRALANRPEYAL
jgi:hypothetical protein